MTTWCRPESSVSPDPATRRSAIARGTGAANGTYLDREGRFARLAYINQQHPARHSIADILGWVEASEEMMASDFGDVDVVCSDEPLDLSLDKSKGSRKEREFERQDIKRAKYHRHHHHHHQDAAVSDAGTDETDAETGVSWNGAGVVQPHLQMAANFSTVLQYYLTAARLWQTSEAMRCQESQDGEAANDGDVPGDPTAAVVAAMAAAAAAANAAAATSATDLVPPAPAAPKKRKKEDVPALVPASSQQVEPASHSGPTRPRKTRTTFTGKQLFELERIFEQKKYLSSNERQEVARLLNVTGSQIKIWFQNRRTKWKKQDPNTAAELAQLKSASRSQAPTASVTGTSSSSATPAKSKSPPHSAEASASEEGHSDDGSSHRSSPTPPV